jgi:hypothetical protein
MLKVKICASLVALIFCLQPLSYSASYMEANRGYSVLNSESIVDGQGNLLFFKTIGSAGSGVQTLVTLVSPTALTATQTYPGILCPIRGGDMAVYAIEKVRSSSGPGTTYSLVALVTTPGALPGALVEYPLSGKVELLKVAPSFPAAGTDTIYLGQYSSSGASVLVLTFDGIAFTEASGGTNPVPLN